MQGTENHAGDPKEKEKEEKTGEWYALRVTYNREMTVKEHCDANGTACFVPMTYKVYERDGVGVKKLEPAVRNLIFIRSTRPLIHELKQQFPVRYIMDRGKGVPITVPEKEMRHFITVAGNYDQQIVYLSPDELRMKTGSRVRILAGVFKGVEGTLVRVKNNRRVVVRIEGVVMVATHYIHPSLLEGLER
jgi:transcription antitermination factor NusG